MFVALKRRFQNKFITFSIDRNNRESQFEIPTQTLQFLEQELAEHTDIDKNNT